ncbi:MAG: FIST C-terminal domain-containing protein [Candidatus Adiutrix sp.]|nr:FIST C-terminal domain-containing protein [Candidatus Adiutrix sp.]
MTASTAQVDDPEAAVAEILEQLDLAQGLLKNSVGIIVCYNDFIFSGTLDSLREHLPFDVIGCTVIGSATGRTYGMEQLSLTVLTSDEIQFSVSMSPDISKDNMAGPIEETWRQARAKLPGDPGLCLAFFPIMKEVSGDQMVRQLDAACGGLPIFGTLSNDSSLSTDESRTFLNGDAHSSQLALLLLHGPLDPRFYVASISPKHIQHQKAMITASEGYMVSEVNNMPFIDYLASIGVQKETLTALTTLPFMVDYGDGAPPVALAIYSISPEGALCGGLMPVGAWITFTEIDYESVMETAESALRSALEDVKKNGANGILAIPCLTRSLMISPNVEDEMKKTVDLIDEKLPFMMLYSGGEVCPLHAEAGALINRFHNYTYTLVVL